MTEKRSGFEALAQSSLYPQEKLVQVRKGSKSYFIGLPKEISLQEDRITLTPDAVQLIIGRGHEVWVESGAGEGAHYTDNMYSEAGAKIVYSAKEVYEADVILKIEPPTSEEVNYFKPGKTLISALQLGNIDKNIITTLMQKKVTALGYEFIEDKVGGFPIVRSMSEIAGNAALFVAAEYLSKGKGIALGGITGVPPAQVVIIGAGTVAEHAARAALGAGADIKIFDNHLYKLRRIKHALGHQIYTSSIDTATLGDALKEADVVIAALRPEKGKNRVVVSEEMVMEMEPDSVIIDLSIDHGGCIETSDITTHKAPIFRAHDVIHYCVPNIASKVARTSTIALSNIFTPTILRAGEEGELDDMIFNHSWFMRGVYIYKGSLTNRQVADKFELECKNLELLMAARFRA